MFGITRIPFLLRMSALTDGTADVSTWSIADRLALTRPSESEPRAASKPCTCGLAVAGDVPAYNEEAFQYLLAVEHKRFERSNRPFVLVLIGHVPHARETYQMDPSTAAKVFAGLARCLRETDVIGWYREGRVVGAVLTHLGDGPLVEVTRLMSGRVKRTLRDSLPDHVADRLNVTVYQPFEALQS